MSDVALRFGARDDGLNAQFLKTGKDLDTLQGKVSKAGAGISASFGKIAAAAATIGFAKLVGDALQFADQLEAATARTGISVEGLQKLQFTASQTSGDLGTLTAAVSRMQVKLAEVGEGSAEAEKALARLQIPIGSFVGLRPDQQFEKVAVAISKISDPAQRTAAAIGLFGKGGAELLPVLVSTGTELEKVTAQFEAIGGPVTTATIGKVDDIGDGFARLKLATTSLVTELLGLAQPFLQPLVDSLAQGVASFRLLSGSADELAKITQNLRFLREERDTGVVAVGKSLFNPKGGLSFLNPTEIDSQIASLERMREHIISLRDVVEFAPVKVDQALVKSPTFVDPNAPTVQDKRLGAINANNSPVVIEKLQEKDLLLKINQDTLDAMLQQTTAHASERIRIESDTTQFLAEVRKVFGLQEIKFEEIKNQSVIELASGLFGSLARENTKLAKIQQGIALAQAIYSTASGIMKAFELPWPASIAAAAKVAFVGAIQIAKIKATNYNGGSVSGGSAPSFSSGGGSAAVASPVSPPPAVTPQRGVAQIIINGPITGEQSMRWLVDRLRENIGDFDLVLSRTSG